VAGSLGSPNDLGSYVSWLMPLAASVLLTKLHRSYKLLALIAVLLGVITVFLTLARGAWTAVAIATLILGILAGRRGWIPSFAVFAVVIVFLQIVLLRGPIFDRVFGDDAGSAESRGPQNRLALSVIEDHPIVGVGPNNFAAVMHEYKTAEFGGIFIFVVHNRYLLTWAETGIIGLLAFVGVLLSVIRRAWQVWMTRDRLMSPIALGIMGAVSGWITHMFVESFNTRAMDQLLWVYLGLVTALLQISVSEDIEIQRPAEGGVKHMQRSPQKLSPML
jgi:O-antigen ligase